MITLNTTFHVDDDIHLSFIEYMKETYITNALRDKQLSNPKLCKVHSHQIEEGHSYSVQFSFNTLEELEKWDKMEGRKLNEELVKTFESKVAGFSSLLEEIEL